MVAVIVAGQQPPVPGGPGGGGGERGGLGIGGAVLGGLMWLSMGKAFAAAGIVLCGVAGALLGFWLVNLLADVADLLADRGRK